MRHRKEKVIYYSSRHCSPFVRNILRSVFCVDKIKLRFVRADENSLKTFWKKMELSELFDRIYEAGYAGNVLKDKALMQELEHLVRRKKKVPDAVREILGLLYPGTGGLGGEREAYFARIWRRLYGEGSFQFKEGTGVNLVNFNETASYLKLFEKQKQSMNCMENATATLLQTLPFDVDTIADIGSGPGLVNQFIPYDYQVLAVDLNEEILKQNSRQTCIGDILDLPLQDQSVDLSMACDVLEHIEPKKAARAVAELQRVSRKYIYIQTPYNEILRYSLAKCPNCGKVWHVNFHKGRFTYDSFLRYENDTWRISQVNYTGSVCNEADNPDIYKKIEAEQMDVYRVDHFECPDCGAFSVPVNLEILAEMEREDNRRENGRAIVPKYSEIGVLFEKRDLEADQIVRMDAAEGTAQSIDMHLSEDSIYSNLRIDLTKPFLSKEVYTGKEQVPVLYGHACRMEKNKSGILVKGGKGSWLGISLPCLIAGAQMELRGMCGQDTTFTIAGIDKEECEFQEAVKSVRKGSFLCKHKMSGKWNEHSTFIKIYCQDDYVLSGVKLYGKEEKKYYFITQEDVEDNHLRYSKNGVLYRYYIPKQGAAFEMIEGQTDRMGWKVI